VNALITEIRELIRAARQAVVHSVDLIQVFTNFEIGRRIVEHEQQGSERNLRSMRKFYSLYAHRVPDNVPAASEKLTQGQKRRMSQGELISENAHLPIWQMPSAKSASPFTLSWSQYVFLIYVERKQKGGSKRPVC
jgi:hypothetical protein